jgi:GTP cyclohydrolase I
MSSNFEILIRAMNLLDGPGTIKQRLASAYRDELQYVGPEGMDEAMVDILETINDELTRIDAEGDKDSIDMSAENLTDYEAQELVGLVKILYHYLGKHHLVRIHGAPRKSLH